MNNLSLRESTPRELTEQHMQKVWDYCFILASMLLRAGNAHDKSKFSDEEWPIFEKETLVLRTLVYGSQEYKDSLVRLAPALKYHYERNSHHPEFHGQQGVAGMTLVDLCECFCDWIAASQRTKNGNPISGIEISCKRFNMPPMLEQIFKNTVPLLMKGDGDEGKG
jgi:hypothetical protein